MNDVTDRLCQVLGYRFTDSTLLQQALTHRSAGSNNNERLEFLGDSVLGFVITAYLYDSFPEESEGTLSRLRASLVKGEALARLARAIRLGEYLNLGSGELKSGGHRRDSILAGSLEALIGAVYLDGGLDAARALILRLYGDTLTTLALSDETKDPKTRLQEYLQARRLPLPRYEVLNVEGREHEQTFHVQCYVSGLDVPLGGSGASRRRAEQDAARHALLRLEVPQGGGS